ncbi:hypothetical protein SKUN_001114 [Spiroplasma kunkelii CR2-3x]|uniref:Transmembrane protein n=1 Tax=Spiroplasma kunkelii CR2-3x TaxID=273035 RepID=A0A0K2JHC6_SPIKU|nr:hypothetical protein [Spiroplasma kunkelii]ALA98000.1 hypothetical protein SKUN_001114 [Spiroplasma kunkelii CR2-3x]
MSRKTILNSKIFTLILSIIILNIGSLILQLIFFSLVYQKDFNQQNQINLVLTSFSFLLLWILWTSIVWVINCCFDNSVLCLTILSFISILFLILYVLAYYLNNLNFHNLKFLTIISLFKSALNFTELPSAYKGLIIAEPVKPKSLDFSWQLPTMFILGTSLFFLGNWIFNKKSLSL